MKQRLQFLRTLLLATLAFLFVVGFTTCPKDRDPLPSRNEGAANKAILDFVRVTTDKSNTGYVLHENRIATFDQDGTLWVEHPLYSQLMYCFDRVPDLVAEKPE